MSKDHLQSFTWVAWLCSYLSYAHEMTKNIFLISLPSSNLTISLYSIYKHDPMDIADPNSMQDGYHELRNRPRSLENLWLSGRASECRILRSEVRFLMGTQNFFFVPRSWRDEKTFFFNDVEIAGKRSKAFKTTQIYTKILWFGCPTRKFALKQVSFHNKIANWSRLRVSKELFCSFSFSKEPVLFQFEELSSQENQRLRIFSSWANFKPEIPESNNYYWSLISPYRIAP